MSKKKTVLIVILAVVLVAALLCVWYFGYKKPADEAAANANLKTITVNITHTDGTENKLNLKTANAYLADALREAVELTGEDSAYGLTITSLDGEEALMTDNASWVFDVNGEMGTMSVDQTVIADGDVYDFYVLTW